MIDSREKAVRESAREGLLQIGALLRRNRETLVNAGRVDGPAVGLRGRGNVMCTLESPFDFETRNAGVGKIVNQIVSGQVLWREQVRLVCRAADFSVNYQIIWKT